MNAKITFITAFLGGTHGTAKSARDFLRALLACQNTVRVVSPSKESFPHMLCGKELGQSEWLYIPKGLVFPKRLSGLTFESVKDWLKDRVKTRHFRNAVNHDLVIVNGWASYSYWQSLQEHFNGPKAIIVRESPRHFDGPDRVSTSPDLLGAFSDFDFLIFVSERICNEWQQFMEIEKKPYTVLPNCCEEEEVILYAVQDRDVVRELLGFGSNDFVVLCPGTIEHRKGQDLLLDVVPKLHELIPNLRILLVGDPSTKWGEDLLQYIPSDVLGSTVIHWNSRPGIMDLLYASDLLAFPSRAEAMPRTILEAMAMKTPIIASDVDGIPELVNNGETGLLFSRNDKEGLLKAILRLYAEPELRKNMSESGSERYWRHFSRRNQFDRMAHALESMRHSIQ
jgi:glycosyltransferase involved in cell wall biosynthesis